MKRTVALVTAVLISAGILSATAAFAQEPVPAPADTAKAGDDSPAAPAAPATPAPTPAAKPAATQTAAPAAAVPDTAAAAARDRRAAIDAAGTHVVLSLGLGSSINYNPQWFKDDYNPSLGLLVAIGARRSGITLTATFDYNFFMSSDGGAIDPEDLSILTIFADLKYMPVHSTARPYLIVCGGLYRQWIVDTNYTENVLGYGGGVGVEMELDRTRRLFLEGRYIQGRTRETEQKANTESIPFRLGVTWEMR